MPLSIYLSLSRLTQNGFLLEQDYHYFVFVYWTAANWFYIKCL